MIRAIIIEDEVHSRNFLKTLIQEYVQDVEIIGEADSVDSALFLIKETSPDLLFLDIELAGENGFDIIGKSDLINYEVIFTTAYQEYAIKAFKYSAVSYILKPVNLEELEAAVRKVRDRQDIKDLNKRFEYLVSIIKQKNLKPDKLALPVYDGYFIVSLVDIVRIEADGSYSTIFLANREKIMVSKNISAIEELLSDDLFIRVHKSYIINMRYLKRFIKNDGNSYVILTDNSTIDVSVRKKKDLIEKLSKLKY